MVILDTDIIIDHIRQYSGQSTHLKRLLKQYGRKALGISVITIQELYVGSSTRRKINQTILNKTISGLKIYTLTPMIAKIGGLIMRDTTPSPKIADSAIAATTIHYGASLATLNARDFIGISGLKLVKL